MKDQGIWHVWAAATAGRSHRAGRKPCQDFCCCQVMRRNGKRFAVGVVADGAGSAKRGRLGAKLACESLLTSCKRLIADNPRLADIGRGQVTAAFQGAREAIAHHARRQPMRDYATTAAVAILGPEGSLFAQIGDSVIVTGGQLAYAPVFWPQNGEFVNTTNFLTDGNFDDHLEFEARRPAAAEVALFSDGLSPIAMDFRRRSAHTPFFSPLFVQLRSAVRRRTPRPIVERELRGFLRSEAVENRVDDDRSLVLICAQSRGNHDGSLLG